MKSSKMKTFVSNNNINLSEVLKKFTEEYGECPKISSTYKSAQKTLDNNRLGMK
jgi:hypothetical protein